jgi:CBS domain-containing protein
MMRTAFHAIAEAETPLVAWELLERTGYHHLAVVRTDGRCSGVLERADLAVFCAAPACTLSRVRVADVPRPSRTVRVHADTTLADAARAMCRAAADAVPVTDDEGRVIGLLTARDLVAALAGEPALPRSAGTAPFMAGLRPRPPEAGTEMP